MKTSRIDNKSKKAAIALILLLAMSSTLFMLPSSSAHQPPMEIPMYAYLSVAPSPVGIGQTVYVNFWLNIPPPTAAGAYGDRWENFKVTVTKPDGTTQALSLGKASSSDAVGGSWTTYTPMAAGKYSFVFSFPGQILKGKNPNPANPGATTNNAAVNDSYLPASTAPVELIVQEQQIQLPTENPLPTGYWERPVQSVNSEWYKISGNWLGLAASTFAATGMYNASGNFNPYTTAPNSAHIVWNKPMAFGGLIGGEFGGSQQSNYYSTSQYEPKFAPIIMNGILYYVQWPGSFTHPAGWVAVDIRTGETLWTKTNTTEILRCGQTLNYVSPNQYGGLGYLWSIPISATGFGFGGGLNYSLWDAMTGNYILKIVGGVPMTLTESADGSLIGYYINGTTSARSLTMWNSTEAIQYPNGHISENWMWRPALNSEINFTRGIMWSKPIATNMSGVTINPGLGISKIASDVVLMLSTPNTGAATTYWQAGWQVEAAYSAIDGHNLWGPLNRTEEPWTRIYMGPAGWGVYTEYVGETMTWKGYSLTTGAELWGPTEPDANAWSYYGCQFVPAYGNFYTYDFGGHVKAYNFQTGEKLWSWNTGSAGYETPYGVWTLWTFTCGTVADGKFFVPEGHMYSPPLFHGAKQWAINATDGKPVWNILSFDVTSAPAIADGYMVTLNAYDNQIYCYGKGKTATTVSAPATEISVGSKVLITGTISDQSPDIAGSPCISDASMTDWMEYMYMQQAKPTNATGVPIKLTIYDPNGNSHYVTTTSDAMGTYGTAWTPPIEGVYQIIATFEGSESYFDSSATTYFLVGTAAAAPSPTIAPATSTPPVTTATPTTTTSPSIAPLPPGAPLGAEFYVAIAAVVIIVVIAAIAIALRRRK